MGYGCKLPADELGKSKNLWVIREYGLYEVWLTRELTVHEPRLLAVDPPSFAMPLFHSDWVFLSLACIVASLFSCWAYVQCIVGPRNGLPIPPGPSGHWLFGTPFPKSR